MDDAMKTVLKQFNDEFMFIWYKGREHILAREEYARVFSSLIPKYFVPRSDPVNTISTDSN
jgi:hypothetical protein